ncbi:family A G protein-coupled receptor-like protein [Neoconidiobolus thromboides FSU 785]|nr:family A G protein-coupled receptor-like protein [Neoconidiobolus thromboides FSU 785]
MILEVGQILALVFCIIGVTLNLVVGGVVTFGLKLRTSDLILIAMIAGSDSLFYLNNIIRMILIAVGYLVPNTSNVAPDPAWWCPYDSTMTLTGLQISIEFVALLSIMRYMGLCHRKKLSFWVWFPLSCLSILSAVGLLLGNWYYGIYHWSESHLFCLPVINPFRAFSNDNRDYFVTWFSSFMGRFFISLIIIVFCYFKVAQVYRQAITQSGMMAIKAQQEEGYESDGISLNEANKIDEISKLNQQIKAQKVFATLKLMGAAFAYIICVLPDMVVSIFYIQEHYLTDPKIYITTHLLMCCGGLVNALFVLSSHDPSKRYLKSLFVKEEEGEEDYE